jgi:murein endopeptidase
VPRHLLGLLLMTLAGCVHATWLGPSSSSSSAGVPAVAGVPLELYEVQPTPVFPATQPAAPAKLAAPAARPKPRPAARPVPMLVEDEPEDSDADEAAGEEEDLDEAEAEVEDGLRYTADLDDETLKARFQSSPETLGSLSFGTAGAGRLMNSARMPAGSAWTVTTPHAAFGTQETVNFLITAITEVARQFPNATPIRVNGISAKNGGRLRPHKSHQSGRDVDLGFYYPGETIRAVARERVIDPVKNWALVKALVTLTDVQLILVDKRIQKVLYEYALEHGEDEAWLDSLFKGKQAIIQHARRHRDHFHVRFFNPRAQELARRVALQVNIPAPVVMKRHKVRRGETLAAVARRYHTTATHLANVNGLKSQSVRPGMVLQVPAKGRSGRLPVPPPVVVPPRRLPPEMRGGPEVV